MSMRYSIENDIIEFLMGDRYTFDEFQHLCLEIFSDPDFKPCMKGLVNLLQARPNPSTQEMREGAAYLGSFEERFISLWAILAPADSLTYGLARMFSVFAESKGGQLEVFTDRKAGTSLFKRSEPVDQRGEAPPILLKIMRYIDLLTFSSYKNVIFAQSQ